MALPRPTSDQYIQSSGVVREKYKETREKYKKNKKANPARNQLLDILEETHNFIKKIKSSDTNISEEELQEICLGAWALCLESIPPEYRVFSPEHKEGLFFNSGSTLYTTLIEELKKLGVDYKALEDKYKLMALEKFHNFIFAEKNLTLRESFKSIKEEDLKQQSIGCLQVLLKRMYEMINNIANGIPAEKVIDNHLQNIDKEYKDSKEKIKKNQSYVVSFFSMFTSENPNRQFYLQLCKAFASIQIGNDKKLSEKELSRSHNIKNGLLLFLTHSIDNEYYCSYLRTGTNSGFHEACRKILNCEEVDNLTDKQKALAVAALQNLFATINWREYLETYGRENFPENNLLKNIDIFIKQIDPQLEYLYNLFLNNINKTNWPLTNAMYKLGKGLGSVLGFGTGWAAGLGTSKTNLLLKPKLALGEVMSSGGTVLVGNAGGHLGFLAADYTIASTAAYALALIFQQTGIVIGGVTLGAIALPVEATYKGVKCAGCYFFDLCKEVDPVYLEKVDQKLIQCLLRLPPETFLETLQNKIKHAVDEDSSPELDRHSPKQLLSLRNSFQ